MGREIDEVNLREIIELLWNGKWIVIITTVISLLISGVASAFVIHPVYEARTTIMVNNLVPEGTTLLSLDAYKEQVKNHGVMSAAISQFSEHFNEKITISQLRSKIETEIVKNTNLIRITVRDQNQGLVAQIANAVTTEYINYINNQTMKQKKTVIDYEIKELDKAILISEAIKSDIINELEKTPQNLVTKKSLSENSFFSSVISDGTNSHSNISAIQYEDEELNPLYTSLQESLADINLEISKYQNRMKILLDRIGGGDLDVLENLIIVSPAIDPEEPIASNNKLIIMLTGVVSFTTSIIIVFIMHYWKTTNLQSISRKRTAERNVNN